MKIPRKKFIFLFIVFGFAFQFIATSLLGSTGPRVFPQPPDTFLGTDSPVAWKSTVSAFLLPVKIILIGPLLLPSVDFLKEDPPPPLVGIYFICYWSLVASIIYSFWEKTRRCPHFFC